MGLESASYISQLVPTNPTGGDAKSTADDHLRLLKTVLQTQFTGLGAAAVTTSSADLNKVGVTQSAASNDTSVASTAFVTSAISTQLTAIGAVTATSTNTLTNKSIDLGSNTVTMTSAQLKTALSDETGSGAAVFATSPALVTPDIGAATASGAINLTSGQISFPATQVPSAGANVLDDYEEGTWTPNQGAGLTVVGAFSSTGDYTKIGRQVTVSGSVVGATSISVTQNGVMLSNLPFTKGANASGNGCSGGNSAGVTFYTFVSGASVYSGVAVPASATTLYFSCTYNV